MRRRLKTAAITAALLLVATPASAAPKTNFIRSFKLPGFTQPTQQQIADLAQTQLDPNNDSENNPLGLTSGFTYFGQFLDHDLTLDTSPPPKTFIDPTKLKNARTFAFDLDSVYGGGPKASPELYAADGKHLLVQDSNVNGVRDLPRRADGSAILAESRNDENEIISQIQVAFLRAHNRLIDSGLSFNDARATLRAAYRSAIKNDFMPHTLTKVNQAQVNKIAPGTKGTPIEFSVAAYRFGHSQVRKAYELNENTGKIQVFALTGPDLRGGLPLQAGREIAWGNFFADLTDPDDADGVNITRKIDPLISSSLFVLPIPGAEATGSNVLAFRNMTRAHFYRMPSGQSVAKSLKLPVITPAQLNLGPGFSTGTPLWYYILAESSRVEDGARLGPTGSTIVKASFDSALKNGAALETGKVNKAATKKIVGPDATMTISDIFVFAGVAVRP